MPTVTLCAWAYGAAIKPIPSKPRIVRYRIFFGPPEICKTDFNFRIAILQNDGQTGLYVRKVKHVCYYLSYVKSCLAIVLQYRNAKVEIGFTDFRRAKKNAISHDSRLAWNGLDCSAVRPRAKSYGGHRIRPGLRWSAAGLRLRLL